MGVSSQCNGIWNGIILLSKVLSVTDTHKINYAIVGSTELIHEVCCSIKELM